MKKTIITILIILLSASLFFISGCNAPEEKVEISTDEISAIASAVKTHHPTVKEVDKLAHPEPEPEPEPEPKEEEYKMGMINPLTGEPTETDITNKRPVSAMLNNISVAMPQVGVSKADMLIELMDEGGITRIQGLFMDVENIEKLGSIRSARAYNVTTALGYDSVLVHAGGSGEAKSMIVDMGLDDVDSVSGRMSAGSFFRDPYRQSYGIEHSLFAVGHYVNQTFVDRKYRTEHKENYDKSFGLRFSDKAVEQCKLDAKNITVTYAGYKQSIFNYDEESKAYTMSQYGSVYSDDGNEIPKFKNVLVIYAPTYLQGDGIHLTIDLNKGGDGYFFTEGKGVEIKWHKDGDYGPYIYELKDGTRLNLNIGKSFVCVNQSGSYTGSVAFE